ncbi:YcaO-like family protein [Bradyrhizobium sp. ARR65]|uniref:YcaO-like family protein n=1 Tax=Bradyrhizobium sp. ARR65 TaxID=1040989 RepID=UPI000463F76A|nr:YcaO-like family protein [Bradyrhizobium sp. ARR65]
MTDMFTNAALLLEGKQPEGEPDGPAQDLLEALGYAPAGVAGAADIDGETRHRARLLRTASRAVRIFELSAPDAPGLVSLGAEFDPALADPLHQGSPVIGVSGVGLSLQQAFERCIGEAIEYLSQLQTSNDALLQSGLGEHIASLDPQSRSLVATLVATRTDADAELSWHPAKRLADGSEIWLPADLCLRRPPARQDFVPPFPLSIGSAAGTSWEGAALHCLLELIERDAASLWWRGGSRGRAVPPEHAAGTEALLVQLRPTGATSRRTWLLDITTDIGIPVVAAVSCRRDGFGFAFGLAARPTLAAAIRSAILEMCQVELASVVVDAKRRERGDTGLNAKDLIHLQRATAINADQCILLQPIGAHAEHIRIDSTVPHATLTAIARHLQARAIEPYCLDLTRSLFSVPVARIIVPSLQLEPSEIVTPRLAETIARTGGGAAYTGGIPLL